jgi:hypothetical protein
MTQDEIIEMADKADEEVDKVLNMKGEYHPNWHQVRDEIFAKLVAAKERDRIFNELFEMHLKAQKIHNYYLHAVMHIKAKDKATGEA